MTRTHLRSRLRDQAGFSLIELLVAMVVLLIGVGGTLAMLDGANARTVDTRAREAGTALAREVVERARSLAYPSITSAGVVTQLQAMEGLADDAPAEPGWQVDRRGTRFTIDVHSCSADDPKDGLGNHDAASWCAGTSGGTADRNPDDYKRVTVDLTWEQTDARGRLHEQTLINSPGNAAGPGVSELAVIPALANDLVSLCAACPTSLTFRVTTTVPPATVSWAVDGATFGTATGSGTTWTFEWPISSLTDGAYLISARAFDTEGRSSATRTRTIRLNRFVPAAPAGFAAGRNGSIVDVEWAASRERDVVGYRVFRRVGGGPAEQVTGNCASAAGSLTRSTSCYDAAPPAGAVEYFVRALDHDDAGQLRQGTASTVVTVTGVSDPPDPVSALTRTDSGTGAVTLSWTAPQGSPPAAFYRIYRDGAAYSNRYDRTGSGDDTTWVDTKTGGQGHTYWVTAVSSQLAESTATAPEGQ